MKLSPDLSLLKKYTNNKQDTFLLLGACLVLFLWFFTYYSKNQDLIAHYHNEIKNLEIKQSDLSHNTSFHNKLESSIKDLKLKLRTPREKSIQYDHKRPATPMIDLAHKACKTGLQLDICSVKKKKNKDWFTQQNIAYEITGQEDQIKKFIKKVQESNHTLRCRNIGIKKLDIKESRLTCTLQFINFKAKHSAAHTENLIDPQAASLQSAKTSA